MSRSQLFNTLFLARVCILLLSKSIAARGEFRKGVCIGVKLEHAYIRSASGNFAIVIKLEHMYIWYMNVLRRGQTDTPNRR